jgi:hypothetical protein
MGLKADYFLFSFLSVCVLPLNVFVAMVVVFGSFWLFLVVFGCFWLFLAGG